MARVVVKDQALFNVMAAALGISFAILTSWQAFDPKFAEKVNCATDWSATSASTTTCDLICSTNTTFPAILISFHSLMLLMGGVITIKIWNVHDAFSESRWLILAIYTQTFSKVYMYAVNKAFNLSSQDFSWFALLFAYLTWLSCTITINLILLPKFWAIAIKDSKVSISDFSRSLLRDPLLQDDNAALHKTSYAYATPKVNDVSSVRIGTSRKRTTSESTVETRGSHLETKEPF
jgi:hypothetical protein